MPKCAWTTVALTERKGVRHKLRQESKDTYRFYFLFGQAGLRQRIRHWKTSLLNPHPKLLVLMYHRILPKVTYNPFNTIVSATRFEAQLDYLMQKYSIISLSSAVKPERKRAPVEVVLTFDDGYEDNYKIAFPILQQRKLPATFFVATSYIDSGRAHWDWEIMTRLSANNRINELAVGEAKLSKESSELNSSFAFRVNQRLKSASLPTLSKVLEQIREQSSDFDEPDSFATCMSWEQVNLLVKGGMEIGAHAASHRSLARIPFAEAVDEIVKSKQIIEDKTGHPCKHFAFPFGTESDYTRQLVDAVRAAGFETGLLSIPGYNQIPFDKFSLKRNVITEETNMRYLLG